MFLNFLNDSDVQSDHEQADMLKEQYFTFETIDQKAGDFLRDYEALNRLHAQILQPEKAALLVIDMQTYFLHPDSHAFIPSAPVIAPRINNLIRICTCRRIPVFCTRHLNNAANAGMMALWWRDLIQKDNPSSKLDPQIEHSNAREIIKHGYDAFAGTILDPTLKKLGISQLIICGVMTHLCCETTARSAFTRGYETFFTVDGTADYNESFHRASLLNLAHGFSKLKSVNQLIADLNEAVHD